MEDPNYVEEYYYQGSPEESESSPEYEILDEVTHIKEPKTNKVSDLELNIKEEIEDKQTNITEETQIVNAEKPKTTTKLASKSTESMNDSGEWKDAQESLSPMSTMDDDIAETLSRKADEINKTLSIEVKEIKEALPVKSETLKDSEETVSLNEDEMDDSSRTLSAIQDDMDDSIETLSADEKIPEDMNDSNDATPTMEAMEDDSSDEEESFEPEFNPESLAQRARPLPDTSSPESMDALTCSEQLVDNDGEELINMETLQNETRKSSRKTKGINHHDFFPSDQLNFKFINSRLPNYNAQQRALLAALKKSEEDRKERSKEENRQRQASQKDKPSTSRSKEEVELEREEDDSNIDENMEIVDDSVFVKPELLVSEYNRRRQKGNRKRKLESRKKVARFPVNCEHYIYRPDFNDCNEVELRKLYSYLKLKTKGFERPPMATIVIDGFPIHYFGSEASMKDCAVFDAFDRVSKLLNDKYPPKPRYEAPAKRPSFIHHSFLTQPIDAEDDEPELNEVPEESDSSSDDELFLMDAKRTKLLPRPRFKVRGKADMRKQTFSQAIKEFRKPTSNGKYDGGIPVSVLKYFREDRRFRGDEVAEKVISLLEKLEEQPAKPRPRQQIFVPLNIKEQLEKAAKNSGVLNVGAPSMLPIKRTILGNNSPLLPVSQIFKKSSGTYTPNINSIMRQRNTLMNPIPARQPTTKIVLKNSPNIRRIDARYSTPQATIVRNVPFQVQSTSANTANNYPILKQAIIGRPTIQRPPIMSYQTVYNKAGVPNRLITTNAQSVLPQRHTLLHASSFNPLPTIAARKIQFVQKAVPSNSLNISTPKVTKIITQISTGSQPSFLKEAPRETYSRTPQFSLLKVSNNTAPANATRVLIGTGKEVDKAAMVNLAKPLNLPNSKPATTVTLTSNPMALPVSFSSVSPPKKTYVRVHQSPTTSQLIISTSGSSSVVSSDKRTVFTPISGTNFSIKPITTLITTPSVSQPVSSSASSQLPGQSSLLVNTSSSSSSQLCGQSTLLVNTSCSVPAQTSSTSTSIGSAPSPVPSQPSGSSESLGTAPSSAPSQPSGQSSLLANALCSAPSQSSDQTTSILVSSSSTASQTSGSLESLGISPSSMPPQSSDTPRSFGTFLSLTPSSTSGPIVSSSKEPIPCIDLASSPSEQSPSPDGGSPSDESPSIGVLEQKTPQQPISLLNGGPKTMHRVLIRKPILSIIPRANGEKGQPPNTQTILLTQTVSHDQSMARTMPKNTFAVTSAGNAAILKTMSSPTKTYALLSAPQQKDLPKPTVLLLNTQPQIN